MVPPTFTPSKSPRIIDPALNIVYLLRLMFWPFGTRALRAFAALALVFLVLHVQAEDDIAEALEAVNRQLAARPGDQALYIQRSRLLELKKQFDQALKDLEYANKLAPLQTLDLEKARIYLSAGWYETGVEHANRYVSKSPDDPTGYLIRGRLKSHLSQVAEAGADFASALDRTKNPTLEMYIEHARVLNTPDGAHLTEALATIEKGIQKFGPIVTLQGAALEIELQQQRYDAALARVDGMMGRSPRKDTWLARRGDVLVKAGRIDEARKAYESALEAINKLTPAQRLQPATKDLEQQIKKVLENVDLKTASVLPQTKILSTRDSSLPEPALKMAPTNEPAMPKGGKVRTYYIAAEETEWDYAPGGNVLQEPYCGDPDAVPGASLPNRIGTRYRKAIFQEYIDGTFQRVKPRSPQWRHLGILGPLLRVEVGDRIKVVFKNRTRFMASLHPHGVFYLKTSEGSGYNDGTSPGDQKDDAVPSNQTYTYEWLVPESAGPGPNDPSSVVWLYHSHVQATRDSNAGLIGAIIVTARGKARPDGTPTDVDAEFVTLFNIFDENVSHLFPANLQKAFGSTNAVSWTDLLFKESNRKHTINGYIFANMPIPTMKQGERVRWYLLGMGTEADLHTAHWHGNTVLCRGYRSDVVELLPASMKVADMVPDNPGTWMFHCHVNDHMLEGMSARYQVRAK